MANWFCQQGRQAIGPVPAKVLIQMASGGLLKPTDLVRKEDMTEWIPASQTRSPADGAGIR
jgi:hypothetical protein